MLSYQKNYTQKLLYNKIKGWLGWCTYSST